MGTLGVTGDCSQEEHLSGGGQGWHQAGGGNGGCDVLQQKSHSSPWSLGAGMAPQHCFKSTWRGWAFPHPWGSVMG